MDQLRELCKDGSYRVAASNDLAYLLAQRHPEKIEEAYSLASEASKAAPDYAPLLDTLGWLDHLRKDDRSALFHLAAAIPKLPNVAEVHYHIGVVYKALGRTRWANYHLSEAATRGGQSELGKRAREAMAD
jgi:tetratricopeptide (TPR) repeat protein